MRSRQGAFTGQSLHTASPGASSAVHSFRTESILG